MVGSFQRAAAVALFSAGVAAGFDRDGCTSIAVSRGATVDGSAMTSHANDCEDCDWRVVYVPAKDHARGALRTVFDATRSAYPRLIDLGRSRQYHAGASIENSTVLGYIPEVPHTHALWEASYGMLNEKGLAIGESTCAAFLMGNGTQGNPKQVREHDLKDGALFTIGNLISIALERCETARCAVQTMGDLSAKYGFYGEDPGLGGAGEATTIADAKGEAWVFHITGGLPERAGAPYAGQRGALWAAQRLPKGHVAVIANNFIIREVPANDTENFMTHPGLFALTREAGLWNGSGLFDFLKIMAPDTRTFADSPSGPIPMYTTLRMWHVFSQVAPSREIQITDNALSYPFSVPVDGKLSHLDVMNLFRTHYEGTPFDMRLGALAGPFSSPNRAEGGQGMMTVKGQIARGISIGRTSYCQVGQTGIAKPKLWFAPDAPASSVFVPFYADVLAEGEGRFDQSSYGEGSMKTLDLSAEVKPAWWAFDLVANWMDKSYLSMSETYVNPKVQRLQREVCDAATAAETKAAKESSSHAAAAVLGFEQSHIQRHVSQEWWSFAGMLIVRYNDYNFNFPEHAPDKTFPIGYPAWWLEMVGFGDRSFFPSWVAPSEDVPKLLPPKEHALAMSSRTPQAMALCSHEPGALSAAAQPATEEAVAAPPAWAAWAWAPCGLAILFSGISFGYQLGRQAAPRDDARHFAYKPMAS